ncbi:hypothetical protein O6P43_020915 [Quillaja saponaria]|uniref:Uncharacterized protein n=1 Tax=Quillaja saponaria TaxID=32244 RepID=A0AAD7PMU8_QUISA|nr:hypothetical protein O6P43_020915 [Quillaja saponaria]
MSNNYYAGETHVRSKRASTFNDNQVANEIIESLARSAATRNNVIFSNVETYLEENSGDIKIYVYATDNKSYLANYTLSGRRGIRESYVLTEFRQSR